jgi:hypothetical protein
MESLDLVLFTAFTPVFCLSFLIMIDIYTAYADALGVTVPDLSGRYDTTVSRNREMVASASLYSDSVIV